MPESILCATIPFDARFASEDSSHDADPHRRRRSRHAQAVSGANDEKLRVFQGFYACLEIQADRVKSRADRIPTRGRGDRIGHGAHFRIRTFATFVLPEAVDDYVGADNPVRFIDAFVDGLDLAAAGFARVEPKATGRPGYAPGDLLKLYIYGYLNRVRSSRRLEAECHRNIEVIWLLRTLKPDFKTIADFRADNRAAFKAVFRQFVAAVPRLDLFGRELLAVDGTRIKAVNNKDRNFTRNSLEKFIKAADERLDEYLQAAGRGRCRGSAERAARATKNLAEKIEALRKKRGRYGAMLAELERTGESQISLTDPDSRAMAAHTQGRRRLQHSDRGRREEQDDRRAGGDQSGRRHGPADADRRAGARDSRRRDRSMSSPTSGYFKIEDIEACEKAGMTPYVPRPQRGSAVREGFFRKDEFRYDAERDAYICPGGTSSCVTL